MAQDTNSYAYMERMFTQLRQASKRIGELNAEKYEPIAIVGAGVRLPGGVDSPEGLWDLVSRGGDGISGFPDDRGWDPGGTDTASYARVGGFLHGAGDFDAGFFGISPREALAMDPQQRLVLETSWEALERAGIDPTSLRGSRAGVFLGAAAQGYGTRLHEGGGDGSEGYRLTGTAVSVLSGRLSYVLGVHGPAVTVDTACSSSLVAIHLAAHALRSGECSTALAGGVTVMATPGIFVEFARQGGLSPDGRCKSFADAADGTGWAEGAGVLVLQRLSDARREGRGILAVVRSTAVNQDGASNGLTAPNGPAQQAVIRQALANADLSPADVDAVEAHGTGTVLGDPIEAQALLATYGRDRAADHPLWLGSLKSNIGHTQAAAGVAGVLKMALALHYGLLPKTLHVNTPSTKVNWTSGGVRLLTEPVAWPHTDRPRRAAVSSFGISGTNAHLILEQAPESVAVPVPESVPVSAPELRDADTERTGSSRLTTVPLVVSARSAGGLAAQAERLASFLAGAEAEAGPGLPDVAATLVRTRALWEHRAVVLAGDTATAVAGLSALGAGQPAPGTERGKVATGGVGVMFAGQGSQRTGMGRELYEAFPVFAEAFDAACAALDERLAGRVAHSVREVVFAGEGDERSSLLGETVFAQAGLFAVGVAMFRLVESFGVRPRVVFGHSLGEVTAAHVAGVLSLADAAALVAARGLLMQEGVAEDGAMVSVGAPEEAVAGLLPADGGVGIAAVNGPASVVVSGAAGAVAGVVEECDRRGYRTRRLGVNRAFHSAAMDPVLPELLETVRTLTFGAAQIPLVSTVTGGPADSGVLGDPGYWVRQVREPVRFADAVATAAGEGLAAFLELGPDGTLTALAQQVLDGGPGAIALSRRDRPEAEAVLDALGELFVRGAGVDWAVLLPAGRSVPVPTTAFQRERYWMVSKSAVDAAGLGQVSLGHPVLAAVIEDAHTGGAVLTGRLSPAVQPWLAEHVVSGLTVVPGAALVEWAVTAGDWAGGLAVEELVIETPLVLPGTGAVRVQVVVGPVEGAGGREVSVHSCPEGGGMVWTRNAVGRLGATSAAGASVPARESGPWPPAGAERVPVDGLYQTLAGRGLAYGPLFQGVSAGWRDGDRLYGEVELPEGADTAGFVIHPALLDAALHVLALGQDGQESQESEGAALPFAWNQVTAHATAARSVRVTVSGTPSGFALEMTDPAGGPVFSVGSLALRSVAPGGLPAAPRGTGDDLFAVDWKPLPLLSSASGASGASASGAGAGGGDGTPPVTVLAGAGDLTTGTAEPTGWALLPVAASAGEAGKPETARVRDVVHRVLAVLQGFLAEPAWRDSRLIVATTNAVAVRPGDGADPVASAVWGLVRSAQSENPGRMVLVDTDTDLNTDLNSGVDGEMSRPGEAGTLSMAVLVAAAGAGEWQFAVRAGEVLVPRVVRAGGDELAVPEGDVPWVLDTTGTGTFEGLALVEFPVASRELEPHEVRVEVRAGGLNFRDVLRGLGMELGAGSMGGEGAGVVTGVGSGVTGLSVGDRVMGLFAGGFGPVAVADARMVVRMPGTWSFEQAASVPVVFMTAYYGLVDLGGLRAGERVLVHAVTGGVGMAAVQLARFLGAEVFGTTSLAKFGVARGMGVEGVRLANSRTLDFEGEFWAATSGAGVDVVLDCLAGEFVDASLRLLPRGGRFLEMGKTDTRVPEEVAAAHPGVQYQVYDLMDAGPERIGQMLAHLVELFDQGVLRPLPVTAWDIRKAPEVFRVMAQGLHTGKNVLRIPRRWDRAGTVLVTGGTGTLGALVARHAVTAYGIRSLILASRRGVEAPGAAELAAELRGLGARVEVVACDTADRDQVRALLSAVPGDVPLTAVVHTAGVLDDGVIAALDPERVDAVFRPKVDAAVHLDELTRELDLAGFVLFSSVAGVLGSGGQGNYAAANAFLDGLAVRRRAAGFPAVSLAWGLWAQTSGMTGHLGDSDRGRMARSGMIAIESAEGMRLLDRSLTMSRAVLVPWVLDVAALRAAGQVPALLRGLAGRSRGTAHVAAAASGMAARLAGLDAAAQRAVLTELVRAEAGVVLGGAEGLSATRAFRDAGFDSLTAVELRNRLANGTGLTLPATLVFDYPSPEVLADYLLGELLGAASTPAAAAAIDRTVVTGDPVVIVGMGVRLPGDVNGPDDLWDLLVEGRDAVSGFPVDRGWDIEGLYDPDPEAAGKSYTRSGGFLYDAGLFDAGFFGISRREALAMDPQQRLLLETSWEALERAGIDPTSLRGQSVGVFAGLIHHDYGIGADASGLEGFRATGASGSVAAGRVSYVLGVQGPAVTVDTACSSSLVALHLAAQALRSGECSMALAGGVTVMSGPSAFVEFSRQGGLAPDGRCKSFSDSADGTGWAEGVGVLVLQRLSDARREGREVLAVVKGTAVNQDGASNGLTAPNGPAQQAVIRQALANAGLTTDDVDAVEAHGTGTVLGDPIEAQALLATYGTDRDPEQPLWLGSLKSNIGHAQAAAGVAGVMKMVLAMRHGVLPRTLHVDSPSSKVDWESGAVRLLMEQTVWPQAGGRLRRAGVSSFGISGTNAHVILEQAPDTPVVPVVSGPVEPAGSVGAVPLVVSARSLEGLAEQAERLASFLAEGGSGLPAVAGALLRSRALWEHRAVVVADDLEAAIAGLRGIAAGSAHPAVGTGAAGAVVGVVDGALGGVGVMFAGQGAQRAGMGRELYGAFPVFAEAFDAACVALDGHLGERVAYRVREVVFAGEDDERSALLGETVFAQAGLFAVGVAMFRMVESFGVRPRVVFGHSLGEVTAAHVAGVLSLGDAAALVAARGLLMQEGVAEGGVMVSVAAPEEAVAGLLPGDGGVGIAAVNGPASVVVSGMAGAVEGVVEECERRGYRTRRLGVNRAFHSAAMDPVLPELLEIVRTLTFHAPRIPLVSTVTGGLLDAGAVADPGYWVRQVREPVRFGDAVATAAGEGLGVLLELGPDGTLAALAGQVLDGGPGVVALSRGDRPEAETALAALGELFVRGVGVDWVLGLPVVGVPVAGRLVAVPTTAFRRQHFWLVPGAGSGDVVGAGLRSFGHPVLGAVVDDPLAGGVVLTGRVSLAAQPWLADHVVAGVVVVPGAVLVEWVVQAGDQVGVPVLGELVIDRPLVVPGSGTVRVQVVVGAVDGAGRREVAVHSGLVGTDAGEAVVWTRHAAGWMSARSTVPAGAGAGDGVWPPVDAQPLPVEDFYGVLADRGIAYGPLFQGVTAVWRRGEDLLGEVELPGEVDPAGYVVHPALVDAALQITSFASPAGELSLPFAWSGVEVHATRVRAARVRISPAGGGFCVRLSDSAGGLVLSLGSVVLREVPPGQFAVGAGAGPEALYGVDWKPLPLPSGAGGGDGMRSVTVVAGAGDLAGRAEPTAWAVFRVGPEAGGPAEPERARYVVGQVLEVLQAFLDDPLWGTARLVVVTRTGTVATPERTPGQTLVHTVERTPEHMAGHVAGQLVLDPVASAVWGLVRSAQTENPGRFVLVDADTDDLSVEVLTAMAEVGEWQIAVRGEQVLVPRLVRVADGEVPGPRLWDGADGEVPGPRLWDVAGTVLVTGGTGALGALVARHAVTGYGIGSVVLASRRGGDAPGAAELAGELRALGARVEIVACDVADRDQVRALLAAVPGDAPLTAVVHTAGVLDDGVITALDPERVDAVFRPKVDAAMHLDELTRELDLAGFVLFSSAAGVLGAGGQGNYAAANAFLDGLAERRRAAGFPAVSLAWGLWDQTAGMTGQLSAADRTRLARSGTLALGSEQGMRLLDRARATARAALVPVALDLAALRAAGDLPAILRELAGRPARRSAATAVGTSTFRDRLAGLDAAARRALLTDLVRTEAAAVLGGARAGGLAPSRAFRDVGFDSLTAVELRNSLTALTGVPLPATVVFDYPNPEALAGYLYSELVGATAVPAAVATLAVVTDDPVVIVGMGVRLPGDVNGPDDLWDLLRQGRDAVSGFPVDRGWDIEGLYDPDPEAAGKSYTRSGGFLHDAGLFDAEFFGISRREALAMDPQQRLLLETSWEALERAGIDPTSLRGQSVGVFAGLMYHDYGIGADASGLEGFRGTGASGSVAAGRVSYVLGVQGPAVTVDTACSSSLVAMHLAAQALRSGECSMALAGGVTVMAGPSVFVEFSRQGGLAPDGRCKSFAEGADGTGWAEGVGVLVLQRLSDARREGREVLAVVKGTAVNQDGASNGLTAPNGPAQQAVIRQALANAGLTTDDVDAVEAHGTGTVLGDPIEAQALLATYGTDRDPEQPLWLGSLKSNIGHTQAASGVAGVIKMVLAMRHGILPRTLHVDSPSSKVDWDSGALRLLTEPVAWPAPDDRPRRAGVSSFGISGTNAHVILEQAPDTPVVLDVLDAPVVPVVSGPVEPAGVAGPVPLVVSARSAEGLAEQAGRLALFLEDVGVALPAVAGSLLRSRALWEHRAVVVAGDAETAVTALRGIAAGSAHPVGSARPAGAVVGVVDGALGGVGVMFAGQGAQRAGMGRELYEAFPVFAEAFDAACVALDGHLGERVAYRVREVVFAGEDDERSALLGETVFAQAGLFAVGVAMFRMVESFGVRPQVVFGHSLGEVTAAHVAGVLSLGDAAALVAARGLLMQETAPDGAMVSVAAPEEAVAGLLPGDGGVGIAAVNGPASVVVSGTAGAVEGVVEECERRGYRTRRLGVNRAFHSAAMDPVLPELLETVRTLTFHAPRIPLVSTVTGGLLDAGAVADPDYWVRQVREPVRFADAVTTAAAGLGLGVLLELGPDGTLAALAGQVLDGGPGVVALSRGDRPEAETVLAALGELFVRGVGVDWVLGLPVVGVPVAGRLVAVPTTVFRRQHFWLVSAGGSGDVVGAGLRSFGHPVLGAVVDDPLAGGVVLTGRVSLAAQPWLADHVVAGVVVVPGAVLVEWVVQAGDQVGVPVLGELVIDRPLVVPGSGAVRVQVVVGAVDGAGRREVAVHSGLVGADAGEAVVWTRHAAGWMSARSTVPAGAAAGDGVWPPVDAQPVPVEDFYGVLADRGIAYGPLFQGVTAVWRRGEDLLGEVELPGEVDPAGYVVHPALVDAALQITSFASPAGELSLPFAWSGVEVHATRVRAARVRISPAGGGFCVRLSDSAGGLVLSLGSVVLREVPPGQFAVGTGAGPEALYGVDWKPLPLPSGAGGGDGMRSVTVVAGAGDLAGRAEPTAWAVFRVGPEAGGPAEPERARQAVGQVLEVLQAFLDDPVWGTARLVVVTRTGTVATPEHTPGHMAGRTPGQTPVHTVERTPEHMAGHMAGQLVLDPVASAVWGLVRSAQTENPGRFVLVDADTDDLSVEVLTAMAEAGEWQFALRGGVVRGPRLVRLAAGAGLSEGVLTSTNTDELAGWHARPGVGGAAEPAAAQVGKLVPQEDPHPLAAGVPGVARSWDVAGTVLVTGGTGALGAVVARHVVAGYGIGSVVLASRRGAEAPGAVELVAELRGLGARVEVVACDVAERDQVRALLSVVPVDAPLTAVVHTAGVLDDGVITALDPERIDTVFRPKVDAAVHLDELTRELDLAGFVLFSSVAGVLGAGGQGNYAAANAFLDGLAERRRAAGFPAVSLAWGLWDQAAGMTGQLSAADRTRLARSGTLALGSEQGMRLLDRARHTARAALVPVALDIAALRSWGAYPAILRELAGRPARRSAATAAGTSSFRDRLAGLDAAARRALLTDLVRTEAAAVLGGAGAGGLAPSRAFRDVGFDSLTAVELRNSLTALTGVPLPATVVFDYPNPEVLAGYLLGELLGSAPAVAASPAVHRTAVTDDPVVIVGMGVRLPGDVNGPDDLWDLLRQGRDAVSGFPVNRGWDIEGLYDPDPEAAGKSYTRSGGFLHDAGLFDAGFFGISRREALAMDPQQRLLLETSWEALERAGIDPTSLRGQSVGVFAGLMYHDYGIGADTSGLEGFRGTGASGSIAAGRVSYVLGVQGPAVTVDTACSSSLVAMHLAAQALRSGECSMALAGGVTVMAGPSVFVEFSRQGGLAPDGRCKSFAEGADGTGWAEGVGVLVLQRLSDARREGREVLAVVKGTAVNQDGASNGLTAPNGPAQQAVIRQALANAGLTTADIDAVEAHGTGTVLGDPIEAQALLATYGADRDPGRPLWLGSLKSNIGHAQAAAGVAGVMKMVLAMRHGMLPRTLHADSPSSKVDWQSGAVRLLTEQTLWPEAGGRPRRAGVSSFGISGTNAHVILEQAPDAPAVPAVPTVSGSVELAGVVGPVPLVVSARSAEGLAGQAGRLALFLEDAGVALPAVAGALLGSRALWEHRAVVVAGDVAGAVAGLRGVADGLSGGGRVASGVPGGDRVSAAAAGVVVGVVSGGGLGPVLVFPGQGAQWVGMGRELWECEPVFAARMEECAGVLEGLVSWSLRDVVMGGAGVGDVLLERVDVVQPVSFAVMVSLAALWGSLGVVPGAVVGHSQGEVAAACVAGVLSLGEALRVVVVRSRVIGEGLSGGGGGMLSVGWPVERVAEVVAGSGLEVAVVNSPSSVVVAGGVEELVALRERVVAEGGRARLVEVDYASHSGGVEAVRGELLAGLGEVVSGEAVVPWFSTVDGGWVRGAVDGGYWYRNLREPVGFAGAVEELAGQGWRVFVEVSPHPVLTWAVEEALGAAGVADGVVVGSLRRGEGGRERFLRSAAELFVRGVGIDWSGAGAGGGAGAGSGGLVAPAGSAGFGGSGGGLAGLPTTVFRGEHFWLRPGRGSDAAGLGQVRLDHPVLGAVVDGPDGGGVVLTGRVSVALLPWLTDHAVAGVVLVPGAALVEWAVQAGDRVGLPVLEELVIEAPVVLSDAVVLRVQVVAGPLDAGGCRSVSVHSSPEGGGAGWVRHATGRLGAGTGAPGEPGLAQWPPAGAVPVALEGFYEGLAERGYGYGPVFRGLTAVWRDGAELFGEVTLPEQAATTGFVIHPALLDAALHASLLVDDGPELLLPFAWNGVVVHAVSARTVRVHIAPTPDGICVEVRDQAGAPVLSVGSLAVRPVEPGQLTAKPGGAGDSLFAVDWQVLPLDTAAAAAASGVSGQSVPVVRTAAGLVTGGTAAPAWVSLVIGTDRAGTDGAGTVPVRVRAVVGEVLEVLQAFLAGPAWEESRLVVITRGGVAVRTGEDVDPVASAVWGLVRSAQSENPGRIVLVDTDTDTDADTDADVDSGADSDVDGAGEAGTLSVAVLVAAVGVGEWQFAVRGGEVVVPRVVRAGEDELAVPDGDVPWVLDTTGTGTFEGLALVEFPVASRVLEPHEVRVGMRAAGLNFRDVLRGLGMRLGTGNMGGEGAGVVTEVGSGVTGLSVGDRVMGLFAGGFGPVAVADVRMLVRVPAGWSFEQAASVPVVFMTAYYGLVDLGGLRAGERVLVHAVTGGVGMAAVQLAEYLGAEVFGTTSLAKFGVARGMGVEGVRLANSRTLDFEGEFWAATSGAGVDVVLDCLAGEFVDASLRLLPRGGRFLEMGKTDKRDPGEVADRYPGVGYQVYDLMDAGPERIGQMLAHIIELFDQGVLRPLPVTAWDIRRAPEVFRVMAQGLHTGKNVLRIPRGWDRAGTVLVTGGTGTLGALVARHAVTAYGIRSLVLASRRGGDAPGAAELAEELRGLGARVEIVACDTADRDQVRALLAAVPGDAPLTAVVHTAGVLDDGVITALDPERIDTVFRPKVDAAVHLDELTRELDLAGFVLFSSAAGVLGTGGQGNYAAANAFLDGLAERRRAAGFPAVSLAWGLWAQASGMTGHLADSDRGRMARSGMIAIESAQGMRLLDRSLTMSRAVLVPWGLDIAALRAAGQVPALLRGLAGPTRGTAHTAVAGSGMAARLAGLDAVGQRAVLTELVLAEAGVVLGGAEGLSATRAFRDAGFDSLTAVELRNRLVNSTGLTLPATLVFDHPNPEALAGYLHGELAGGACATAVPEVVRALDDLAALLAALPESVLEDATVTSRIRALTGAVPGRAAVPQSGDAAAEEVTPDNIFDLIDKELGFD